MKQFIKKKEKINKKYGAKPNPCSRKYKTNSLKT